MAAEKLQRSAKVVDLASRVRVLPRLPIALPEMPVVERERDEPPRGHGNGIVPGRLFLDAGERAPEDERSRGMPADRHAKHADDVDGVDLECDAFFVNDGFVHLTRR